MGTKWIEKIGGDPSKALRGGRFVLAGCSNVSLKGSGESARPLRLLPDSRRQRSGKLLSPTTVKSTTSEHGLLYVTEFGVYLSLTIPPREFSSASVEVTQIAGINNLGEIPGFDSDFEGAFHGLAAFPDGVSCTDFGAIAAPQRARGPAL